MDLPLSCHRHPLCRILGPRRPYAFLPSLSLPFEVVTWRQMFGDALCVFPKLFLDYTEFRFPFFSPVFSMNRALRFDTPPPLTSGTFDEFFFFFLVAFPASHFWQYIFLFSVTTLCAALTSPRADAYVPYLMPPLALTCSMRFHRDRFFFSGLAAFLLFQLLQCFFPSLPPPLFVHPCAAV